MKDNLPRYTLRVSKILLDKLGYVAEYEGRTKNREIEQLIKKKVAEFEKEHGEIKFEDQLYKNSYNTKDIKKNIKISI